MLHFPVKFLLQVLMYDLLFCRIYHFEIAVNSYVPDVDDVSLAWDLDLVKWNYSHYGPSLTSARYVRYQKYVRYSSLSYFIHHQLKAIFLPRAKLDLLKTISFRTSGLIFSGRSSTSLRHLSNLAQSACSAIISAKSAFL